MKKIRITIEEFNCNNNFEPIEKRECETTDFMSDFISDCLSKDSLEYVLDGEWAILKTFFLNNRDSIPFTKIRREDEKPIENKQISEE